MPPRIYIFLWLLSNNKTLTRDNLAKRRNVEDSGPLSISYLQSPRAPAALHLQPRRGLLLTAGLCPHLAPLCRRQPPPCAELPLWPAVRRRSAQALGCILLPPEVKMGRQGRGAVWSYVLWLRLPSGSRNGLQVQLLGRSCCVRTPLVGLRLELALEPYEISSKKNI